MDVQAKRKKKVRIAVIAVAAAIFLFVYVDDWGRDFTGWSASLEADSSNPNLRPLATSRPTGQMVEATKMAARRISNWRYVGDSVDGETTRINFVRTNRILRVKDDVTIRIDKSGRGSVVSAESRARLHVGDLGRNPRNLQRFMSELKVVLDGSVPAQVIERRGSFRS